MKRSRQLALVMMGQAPFLLTGCDVDSAAAQQVKEGFYTSVNACVADGNSSDYCQRAYASALQHQGANGSTYNDEASCRAQFGDRCDHRETEHGTVWMPMLEGFMLAQLLRPNYPPSYGYSAPVYRLRDGQFARSYRDDEFSHSSSTSSGSTYTRVTSAPNRAITMSRSGFGSVAAARGAWGGSSHGSSSSGSGDGSAGG